MSAAHLLLLGTTKGAFLLSKSEVATDWSVSGPHCDGAPINHVIGDPVTGMIWAAGGGEWFGPHVWRSADNGTTWDKSNAGLVANEGDPDLVTLWSLGRTKTRLYAGAKPAGLYESTDNGETWHKVQALGANPAHKDWQPGAAGLVLHSIVSDPANDQKLWVGISAAGTHATEDGGKTWEPRNRRSNLETVTHGDHDHGDQVGICVHNIVRASGAGDLMYQQNHHGAYRSPDGGRTWHSIAHGLPSTFGFPIAVHPHDPQTLWVFPLNGDSQGRFPPGAAAAVWRSRDGGDTWQELKNGLPEKDCFFTVLRQAMAVDQADVPGLYFGTNSGSVFASLDEGDTWAEIARHLPTVLSVETLQLAPPQPRVKSGATAGS